jgi:hypothetical protein
MGLSKPHTHMALPITHNDQCGKREAATTFHDLGHAVNRDHPVGQLQHTRIDLLFSHSLLLKN